MSSATLPTSRTLVVACAVFLLVPPLLGAKGGCSCDPCKRHPERCDTGESDSDAEWQRIRLERRLQVSRLVPDLTEPMTGFTADVLGAGIKAGAKVTIGLEPGTNVTVHTEARLSVDVPPLPEGTYDITVSNADGEQVTLSRGLTVRNQPRMASCQTHTVFFGLDQDTLSAESRSALDPLVPCLTEARGRIRLEGHADERGTTDYNLALGQRRADAVTSYLVSQAVPVTRLRTVSYGEERPADTGHGEAAWARNRRVEIVLEDK